MRVPPAVSRPPFEPRRHALPSFPAGVHVTRDRGQLVIVRLPPVAAPIVMVVR